jgi:hypothetical protein
VRPGDQEKEGSMSVSISSRIEGDVLLIKTTGDIRGKGLIELVKQMYGEISRHDCTRIILNHLELELPTGLIEYVNLEKFLEEHLPFNIRFLKLASVVDPKYSEVGSFWETYCNNRGFSYKVFTSLEDASAYMAQLG